MKKIVIMLLLSFIVVSMSYSYEICYDDDTWYGSSTHVPDVDTCYVNSYESTSGVYTISPGLTGGYKYRYTNPPHNCWEDHSICGEIDDCNLPHSLPVIGK